MSPVDPFCNAYEMAYDGAAFQLGLMMNCGAKVGGAPLSQHKLLEAFRFLPLNRFDAYSAWTCGSSLKLPEYGVSSTTPVMVPSYS